MPIDADDLRSRGIATGGTTRDESDLPFGDLVYLMAEGVAEAQTKLDLSTAELLAVLAETDVDVVDQVTRRIEADGSLTTDTAAPESRSLLELGFTPTRYQFSEATLEMGFDLSLTEEEETESEHEGREFGGGRIGLRAGTYEVNEYRKYRRDVSANANLTATLEPVPLPTQLSPTETLEEPEEENGEA